MSNMSMEDLVTELCKRAYQFKDKPSDYYELRTKSGHAFSARFSECEATEKEYRIQGVVTLYDSGDNRIYLGISEIESIIMRG